jgi:carbon starvation protein
MSTLVIAVLAFVGYIIAYNTYGRYVSKKLFRLNDETAMPSETLRDDADYVPTNRWILFGHHFTSIAGTGPIVGPAIAVLWGWLPALIWVFFGSIFIGAVHDFSALIISTRNDGQSIGDVAGGLISPRVRLLFLAILAFGLMLVVGVFGLVIANIFIMYPESIVPVWLTLPMAVLIGVLIHRKGRAILIPSLVALVVIYATIAVCSFWLKGVLPDPSKWNDETRQMMVVFWTVVLLIYCYVASVLPVWMLLQPRDYINSLQLFVAMALMVGGVFVASLLGGADIVESAPAVMPQADLPSDAPPIFPFLFVTIACGAVSGFHSLVSSGTSSKQLACESDARMIGYGSMLFEGALAVLVILACCAGIGMGIDVKVPADSALALRETVVADDASPPEDLEEAEADADAPVPMVNVRLEGREAWNARYTTHIVDIPNDDPEKVIKAGDKKKWNEVKGLGSKISAFVDGGANFIGALGVPIPLAIGIVAVLVAGFAATTLDTATRLQRYIIQELSGACKVKPLTNKYVATAIAVGTGGAMGLMPGPGGIGTGGLILWPLFASINQLIAGLALMVGVFYLIRNRVRPTVLLIPMAIMVIIPVWALLLQIKGWIGSDDQPQHLIAIGIVVLLFEAWLLVEACFVFSKNSKDES